MNRWKSKSLFGRIRSFCQYIGFFIKPNNDRISSCKLPFTKNGKRFSNYDIGDWTYGSPAVFPFDKNSKLRIGQFCSITNGVVIFLGGEHRTDWVTTFPLYEIFSQASFFSGYPYSKGDMVIGNDVWIGLDSVILSDVKIGNGSVIEARSLVSKDIEAYSIVAGNPAQVIRYRFDDQTINILQEISWWDWPIENIEEAWPMLLSSDIKTFIDKYWQQRQ